MRPINMRSNGYEARFQPTYEPDPIIDQTLPRMTIGECNWYAQVVLGIKPPNNEEDQ